MSLKILFITALALGFTSCSSSEKKAAFELKKSLSSSDIAFLDLAVNLQKEVADEVWPGFASFTTSVVYFTQSGQFLLNPKGPTPSEYKLTNSDGPNWSPKVYSTTEWHAQDGSKFSLQEINTTYLANAFSSYQTDKHFAYSIFFLDSIERFHFKDMKWDVDDWLAIFWHEVFHNQQDSLYSAELVSKEATDYSHVKAFVESERFLKKIKGELRILTKALKTIEPNSKRKLICQKLVPMKLKRYENMPIQAVTSEQFYEISEGTARYVEELMSLAAAKLLISEKTQKQYYLPGFNFFRKYAVRDRNYYFDSIQDVSPKKRYFYNTGFGLALLLDQVQPGWKNMAFQQKGFLFAQIKNWCEK